MNNNKKIKRKVFYVNVCFIQILSKATCVFSFFLSNHGSPYHVNLPYIYSAMNYQF